MKKKKHLALFFFLVTLFWFVPADAQFDIALSPVLVQIDVMPGARKYFNLHVSNENDQATVNLIAYTMDMEESREGYYEVVDEGESQFSCADWMTIEDTSFTLEPGGAREIKVYVNPPPGVFGGRYGAVVFEVVPQAAPPGEKLGATEYHFRLPAFVEISVKRFGGLVRKASITDFTVQAVTGREAQNKLGTDGLRFTASVTNEGNIHVDGKGTLIIRTKEGRTVRRVPLGGGRGIVIPEATVDFKSLLRKPRVGEYVARAVISFGGLSPSVAEVPFVVSRKKTSVAGSFTASSALALDVKPDKLEFKTPKRGFRAATFSLGNDENEAIRVKVHLRELEFDHQGDLITPDSSETGRSCLEWIQVDPTEFTIASGKRAHVRLTIQAPTEGDGGYYACLVFDALMKGEKEGVISSPFQIPVIMSIPPALDRGGEIADLEITASAGRPATVAALFRNTGNIHVRLKGKVSLEKLKEVGKMDKMEYVGKSEYEKVDNFDFERVDQYVLPGGMRAMVAGYPGALDAGNYRAEIVINYGGTEPVKLTKEFRIK